MISTTATKKIENNISKLQQQLQQQSQQQNGVQKLQQQQSNPTTKGIYQQQQQVQQSNDIFNNTTTSNVNTYTTSSCTTSISNVGITNPFHKTDIKSNNLIDEITDLREVLRQSVIGPLSREIINSNNNNNNNFKKPTITTKTTKTISDLEDDEDDEMIEHFEEDWMIKQHLLLKEKINNHHIPKSPSLLSAASNSQLNKSGGIGRALSSSSLNGASLINVSSDQFLQEIEEKLKLSNSQSYDGHAQDNSDENSDDRDHELNNHQHISTTSINHTKSILSTSNVTRGSSSNSLNYSKDLNSSQQSVNSSLNNSVDQISIEKEKIMAIIQDYQKVKQEMRDQTQQIQSLDEQLNEMKANLELKKKKISMLKNPNSTNINNSTSVNSNGLYNINNNNHNNSHNNKKQHQSPNSYSTSISSPQLPLSHQHNIQNYQQHKNDILPSSPTTNKPPIGKHNSCINFPTSTNSININSPNLNKKEQLNNLAQNLNLNIGSVSEEELNNKISEVLATAKYRIERIQFKNRVLLTSHLHNLSTEIHQLIEKRITKKQVNLELKQNAKIVGDCEQVGTTILNFLQELLSQKLAIDESVEQIVKKRKIKSKETKQLEDLEKRKRKVESAVAFLNIEKRSVRELRDRFVSVCNEVTRLYEATNTIERDLSKWDVELERIYLQTREGFYSDYFKLYPLFQSCSLRIKDHYHTKQDLIRELARREAARIASEIYISGIVQILECGHDLITDERMVDVARVRGLEHQVHMLYHSLHDAQVQRFN